MSNPTNNSSDYIFHMSMALESQFRGGVPDVVKWLRTGSISQDGIYRFRRNKPDRIALGRRILFSIDSQVLGTAVVSQNVTDITNPEENPQVYFHKLKIKPSSIEIFENPISWDDILKLGITRGRVFKPISPTEFLEIRSKVHEIRTIALEMEVKSFKEGAERREVQTVRERNSELKAAAIHKYGLDCKVCGFNFEQKYGSYARGYIELHHLIPLSQVSENVMTKLTDIILVCSNCHRTIHLKKKALDWRMLRKSLKH